MVLAAGPVWAGLPIQVSLFPTADSFVREQAPTLNYGGAGLLCAGGPDSVNAGGQQNGRFESVMQFDASEATGSFDSAYEPGRWVISRMELRLFENGEPGNSLFPRGVGQFSVKWMSADGWTQGNGTPMVPMPASGTVICWSLLQTLLAGGTEETLGTLVSTGTDEPMVYPLPFQTSLESELNAGGVASLHIVPITPTIGFSVHSTNYFDSSKKPVIYLVAVPRGDADGNGLVTSDDIGPFVTALLTGALPNGLRTAVVDMNQDGVLDGRDVQGFVARLGVF